MVFSSTEFLFLFLPAVLILYFLPGIKSRTYKNIVLLLASLGFYAWGEPVFVFLMILSILVNWYLGLLVGHMQEKRKKKGILTVAVLFDAALLFVFKYASFLSRNLAALTGNEQWVVSIALPIGISFFTFQLMSYVFDIYYGKAKAQKNVLDVALYVALFPQLIAGPIVRYESIEQEIHGRVENSRDFTQGMLRFAYGLAKKVLISNYLGLIADRIFAMDSRAVATAWLGIICYTLQIYFDFSGYSDMAIGLGKVFGFHFPENFNYPYIAKSITEFWRRWHISLSTWFRDYVYIPMGGNRVKKSRWIFNMLTVWFLTGIWHGANWTFLAWGLFYFVILLLEKLTGIDKQKKSVILARIYTLFVVMIAWILFRSDSLSLAGVYIGNLFGIGANGWIDTEFITDFSSCKWILLAGVILSAPIVPWIQTRLRERGRDIFIGVSAILVFLLAVLACTKSTYNPFIYFNF